MGADEVAGELSEMEQRRNRSFGVGLVDDPYPRLHDLRNQCPVHTGGATAHFPELAGREQAALPDAAQVLSAYSYDTVADVFRRNDVFSSTRFYTDLTASIGFSGRAGTPAHAVVAPARVLAPADGGLEALDHRAHRRRAPRRDRRARRGRPAPGRRSECSGPHHRRRARSARGGAQGVLRAVGHDDVGHPPGRGSVAGGGRHRRLRGGDRRRTARLRGRPRG